jgi:hypothetical protein
MQYPADPFAVGQIPPDGRRACIDRANAELPKNPNARAGAAVYSILHNRHKYQLRQDRANAATAIHLADLVWWSIQAIGFTLFTRTIITVSQ